MLPRRRHRPELDRRGLSRQTHRRMRYHHNRLVVLMLRGRIDAADVAPVRPRDVADPWAWD